MLNFCCRVAEHIVESFRARDPLHCEVAVHSTLLSFLYLCHGLPSREEILFFCPIIFVLNKMTYFNRMLVVDVTQAGASRALAWFGFRSYACATCHEKNMP